MCIFSKNRILWVLFFFNQLKLWRKKTPCDCEIQTEKLNSMCKFSIFDSWKGKNSSVWLVLYIISPCFPKSCCLIAGGHRNAGWVSSVIYVTMQLLHEHRKMSYTFLIYTSWQWPGQHYYRARPASETVQSPLALWSWDRRLLSRVRVVKVSLCQEDGSWPENGHLQFSFSNRGQLHSTRV